MWRTKAEIVGRIADAGLGNLIAHTRSCSRVRDMTKLHPHCGLCSQCIDRRIGVLAAGLDQFDPVEAYRTEPLLGSLPPGPDREMSLGYVRMARRVSQLDDVGFFANYGEANRALRYFEEPADTVAGRIFDLYQRQAQSVIGVVEWAINSNARPLAEAQLAPDCLLALAVSPHGEQIGRPLGSAQAGEAVRMPEDVGVCDAAFRQATVVQMTIDPDRNEVAFAGLGVVRGASAQLLIILAEPFRKAVRAELPPEQYPFMTANELLKRSGCGNDEALRRRILILRNRLRAFTKERGRPELPTNAVIENIPWHGYRLNPEVRIVSKPGVGSNRS